MDTVLGWKADADPMVFPNVQTPKNEIYADYVDWCQSQGQGAVRAESFWKRLRSHLGVTDEQLVGPRLNVKNKRVLTVRLLIHQPPVDQNEEHPFV